MEPMSPDARAIQGLLEHKMCLIESCVIRCQCAEKRMQNTINLVSEKKIEGALSDDARPSTLSISEIVGF